MRALGLAAAVILLAGCTQPPAPPAGGTSTTAAQLELGSPAFAEGDRLPERFSCRGAGVSPPLNLSGVPQAAGWLALVLDDPDAPRGLYTHWTTWDLPASVRALPEGADIAALGGTEGNTTKGIVGYFGPCADKAEHRYVFHLHALRAPLGLAQGAAPEEVRSALAGASLAEATLTARYGPSA